jgi:hypothetical protein
VGLGVTFSMSSIGLHLCKVRYVYLEGIEWVGESMSPFGITGKDKKDPKNVPFASPTLTSPINLLRRDHTRYIRDMLRRTRCHLVSEEL